MTGGRGWQGYGPSGSARLSSEKLSPSTASAPGAPSADRGEAAVDLAPGRPPIIPLAAALATALLGCVVALFLGDDPGAAWAAWALSGPVPIVLLAWFARQDVVARTRAAYGAPAWLRPVLIAAGVLVVVGLGLSAWRLAGWAGHL